MSCCRRRPISNTRIFMLPTATIGCSAPSRWSRRPACPLIPPLGESLPTTEVFRRLATRFGFTEPCFAADDAALMDDAVDGADPRLGGVRPSEMPIRRALQMAGSDGEPLGLFDNVF